MTCRFIKKIFYFNYKNKEAVFNKNEKIPLVCIENDEKSGSN